MWYVKPGWGISPVLVFCGTVLYQSGSSEHDRDTLRTGSMQHFGGCVDSVEWWSAVTTPLTVRIVQLIKYLSSFMSIRYKAVSGND
jgi:hypothetical protein